MSKFPTNLNHTLLHSEPSAGTNAAIRAFAKTDLCLDTAVRQFIVARPYRDSLATTNCTLPINLASAIALALRSLLALFVTTSSPKGNAVRSLAFDTAAHHRATNTRIV